MKAPKQKRYEALYSDQRQMFSLCTQFRNVLWDIVDRKDFPQMVSITITEAIPPPWVDWYPEA